MRKRLFTVIALLCCLGLGASHAHAENTIQKETYIYSIKDADTLRLDKYDMNPSEVKPCVIFVFGGGFFTGMRDNERYVPFFHYLVENGFSVVSIDYRLGFKNIQQQKGMKGKDYLALFEKTIYMAVEDLFGATNYVLERADEWGIDRNMIIACGSSAGAITVLQGEYERSNRTQLAQVLPADFNYAGVISFAGAIYSNKGHLKWQETPAPIQLFHGDADNNVPFNKIKIFRHGLFGSKYIAKKYDKNKFPYYFYVEEKADHKVAGSPMTENREEIMSFIDKNIVKKESLQTHVTMKNLNQPEVKKKFKMKDYIRKNYKSE